MTGHGRGEAPMTVRLYYDDAYCRDFDAAVTRVEARGNAQAVWLDRSAFYPTSGGQPFDTGTLAGGRVVDVIDEDDDVVHVVEGGPPLVPGAAVHGAIDWTRRFDHMQHHTGQHVLSAAILRACQVPTVSFHLGRDGSTIDIARELSSRELTQAEDDANRVIWENRPVTIRYADAADVGSLGLRKPSQRAGTLRIVDIADVDVSACGGSHVERTGAIGAVVIRAAERFKGGQRIEFLCGGRAVQAYRQLRDTVAASVRLLSILPTELPATIERLQGELKQQDKTIGALRSDAALAQADRLAQSAEAIGRARWIFHAMDGDAAVLKTLAQALATRSGLAIVLVSPAPPALIVVARSADVAVSSDVVVKALVEAFGGRGGGRPELAQAGKLDATGEAILAAARSLAAQW